MSTATRLLTDDAATLAAVFPAAAPPQPGPVPPWCAAVAPGVALGASSATLPAAGSDYWREILLVGAAESSQYDALRAALTPHPPAEPVACLALAGSGFHGQDGRPWTALPGNLHLCAALPADLPASTAAALPMLAAVAACDAVRRLLADAAAPAFGIKWVNDVLVGGRKIAGVLTAARTVDDRVRHVVVGLGLNVAAAPPPDDDTVTPGAVCLAAFAPACTLGAALGVVLEGVRRRLAELHELGPRALHEAYVRRSLVLGSWVIILESEDGIAVAGRVTAIEPDLALRLAGRDAPVRRGRLMLPEKMSRARARNSMPGRG